MILRCPLPHRLRLISLIVLAQGALLASASLLAAAQNDPKPKTLLQKLEARASQQAATIAQCQAFHDFRFTDEIVRSGITFQSVVVDDAGKNWLAGHYDHGNGIAVADVDGDGLYDIFFVNQLGSCELWRNLGGGRFENITEKAGVALTGQICVSASFADVDNDGDPDLFVTTVRHGNVLFENLGGGRFRDVSKEAGLDYSGHSSGAVFFDFDNDGLLDLFLTNVGVYTTNEKGRGGFFKTVPDAFLGHLKPERTEYKILYRNLGKLKFKDVSAAMHLRDGSWSGDATFCDLNNDRYPDLYVINMQGDDHYYENREGKEFIEKTSAYFPKTSWGAMGVKFFDFNNDGLMDLYVTDMHSDMTGAQQKQAEGLRLNVEKQKNEALCAIEYTEVILQGGSNNIFGNSFYENLGGGKFRERSDELNLETFWPWGISVGDLNADGFQDVFVSGGMGCPFQYGINSVLLNHAGKRFFDAEFALGVEPRPNGRLEKVYFTLDCSGEDKNDPRCAGRSGQVDILGAISTRSAAVFDLDNDGDLDIVTNEFNDRPQILVSNLTSKRPIHYVKIKLVGSISNRDGLGATVRVRAGDKTYTQYHDGKSGYMSQSSLPLYFGLGESSTIDRVEVDWPSGKKQIESSALKANTTITLKE